MYHRDGLIVGMFLSHILSNIVVAKEGTVEL